MSTLDIPADLASLRKIGPWISDLLAEADQPSPEVMRQKMELALQEVCVNVIEHAYEVPKFGRIRLSSIIDEYHVAVTVADSGSAFNPDDRPEVDIENPTIGGYGLFLVDSLCSRVRYERIGEENRWVLIFPRSAQKVA